MSTPTGPFESLVVLGESTVQGGDWLARRDERWPDMLYHLLETAQEKSLRYHNAGLGASVISPRSPGYESSAKPSAAERLETEVVFHKPDLAVIAYGLNDMRAGMHPDAFEQEMKKIILKLRKTLDPMIVLANVYHMSAYDYYPPFNKGNVNATRDYNTMLCHLAEKNSCVYADVWRAEGQRDYVIHPDTVHANKIGNMLIAHKVFEVIVHATPGIAKNVQQRDATTEWTRQTMQSRNTGVEKSDLCNKTTPG